MRHPHSCSEAAKAASSNLEDVLKEHDLETCPELKKDVLSSTTSFSEILLECGIQPASEQADRRSLVHRIITDLQMTADDKLLVGKVESICLVVHYLLNGQSMLAYEKLHDFMVKMGCMPPATRFSGDDAAWRIACIADDVVLEEIKRRMNASKFIAFSIDDSADATRQEQCCIIVYLLHEGQRESHLLKFHELPGARACGSDIARCGLGAMYQRSRCCINKRVCCSKILD